MELKFRNIGLVFVLSTAFCQAAPFEAHTFTLKPINVNFYSYTFGRPKVRAHINKYDVNVYHGNFCVAGDRADRSGVGYDIEAGYMITSNVEAFLMVGFTHERPFKKVVVRDQFLPFTDNAFNFKKRLSFSGSIGGRYYWDTGSAWIPFAGMRLGIIRQEKTKADVSNFVTPPEVFTPLGSIKAQASRTLVDGALQIGVDYRFTKTWHLTMMSGLQYHPRGKKTTSNVAGRTITYRDNWSKWSIPFVVSLKIAL